MGAKIGHLVSIETREKLRKSNLGKKRSEETCKRIGLLSIGRAPWNKGKKNVYSVETLTVMRLNKLGKKIGPYSAEHRKKISEGLKGKNNYFWKGGITPINHAFRMKAEYKEWRISVFQRDNYTCQECNQIGGKLNADHIKKFADYPELRLDINNGRTLCIDCHKLTPTYGRKQPV